MRTLKIITFSLWISLSSNLYSQVLNEPNDLTDSFLKALKIIDLPEGKTMMKGLVFKDIKSIPVISTYEVLFEGNFDTDIIEVKGYKKLVLIKGSNKNGGILEKRFLIISYKDLIDNKWKVFEFRESINLVNEVQSCKHDIENPRPTDPREPQYKYRNLAYWQILNGELRAAHKSIEISIEEAKKMDDSAFYTVNLSVLNRIIPN